MLEAGAMLRLLFVLVPFAIVVAATAACNGSLSERASAAGGTPAPDGADGFCCPAKTGACGLTGGYREEGTCPKDFDICDNMCEQAIVEDEHGCDKLTYTPCSITSQRRDAAVDDETTPSADAGSDASPDGGSDS